MNSRISKIYSKFTPRASNLLPKWPSDLSNCMGAVSQWGPYKAVGCYFLVCALCISIQQMSKLILQPKNALPCDLLHCQQHISEIVSSLLKQRIGMIHGWGETSIAIDLPAIQGKGGARRPAYAIMSIILSHNVQSIQFVLVVIEKRIFYSCATLFDINAVVIEMKGIYWKTLKWAFCPIPGCKTPTLIWDKTPGNVAKWPLWGKTPQYGTKTSFLHTNRHNQ